MASKHCPETMKSMVTMDFVLSEPKNYDQNKAGNLRSTDSKDILICSSVEDAKATSHCQNVIKHTLMQCDLPNLVHLTNTLSEAVNESKSQHIRKIQRAL